MTELEQAVTRALHDNAGANLNVRAVAAISAYEAHLKEQRLIVADLRHVRRTP
jgi:hypothetical protein